MGVYHYDITVMIIIQMANLQEELSEKACGVLFELIRVAQQV